MEIRGDSYSSVNEVTAFTRYLLQGQTAFNSTTLPTLTEVEKFIDRASAHINVALSKAGLSPSGLYANSTAKILMDDWVTQRASEYVEFTQRGVGFNDAENERWTGFRNMAKAAANYVKDVELGLKRLGVTVDNPTSQGLTFTGLTAQANRADPENTSYAQPFFSRNQFNNTSDEEG